MCSQFSYIFHLVSHTRTRLFLMLIREMVVSLQAEVDRTLNRALSSVSLIRADVVFFFLYFSWVFSSQAFRLTPCNREDLITFLPSFQVVTSVIPDSEISAVAGVCSGEAGLFARLHRKGSSFWRPTSYGCCGPGKPPSEQVICYGSMNLRKSSLLFELEITM